VRPRGSMDTVKRKIPSPCQELNPSNPACSLVVILTELSHLCYQHLHRLKIWVAKSRIMRSCYVQYKVAQKSTSVIACAEIHTLLHSRESC
jgi:hypothetical protein